MNQATLKYLKEFLQDHIKRYFVDYAYEAYMKTKIRWVDWEDLEKTNQDVYQITLPFNVPSHVGTHEVRIIGFQNTELKVHGKLHLPKAMKIDEIWEVLSDNSLTMNCSFVDRIIALLFRLEEASDPRRDAHKRFLAKYSPRKQLGLLSTPEVNNLIAVLVSKCVHYHDLKLGKSTAYSKVVRPVTICLSHDVDQLTGNDIWSQSIRVYRALRTLTIRPSKTKDYLKAIIQNHRFPYKYYWDDLIKMHSLEKSYGYQSVNYILCGNMGRLRCRTPKNVIIKFLSNFDNKSAIGMHYNYDTTYDMGLFIGQKAFIEKNIGVQVKSGRAHYLKLDTQVSFNNWADHGIQVDETLGYPDELGYRAGIAGVFYHFDQESMARKSMKILPLALMDGCIGEKYRDNYGELIEEQVKHLAVVGGTFSLLFHPGRHQNPENSATFDIYGQILEIFKKYNCESILPTDL